MPLYGARPLVSDMNGRELYTAIYSGDEFDRIPIAGVGAWNETLARWQAEGLSQDQDPNEVLGLVSDDTAPLLLDLNMHPLFEIKVIDKNNQYVTLIDEYGVTKKMMATDFARSEGKMAAAGATSGMSHWVGFPVKDMESWKRIFEERFRPDVERTGYKDKAELKAAEVAATERWIRHFSFPFGGMFSAVRQLMGLQGAVYAMADDPRLIHTIVNDLSNFYVETFALIVPELRLDGVTCFEDMCSNRAPLLSPKTFHEFFAPGYTKYLGALKDMGVQQVFIDTDGDCRLIVPELLECGFTGVHPCEIKAGVSPGPVLEKHKTICCNGGIDKRAIAEGGEALENEMKTRFETAWKRGRYTPGLDHSFPPDISWNNVRRYAELFVEMSHSPWR